MDQIFIYMNPKAKTCTYNHRFYTPETVTEKCPSVSAAESPHLAVFMGGKPVKDDVLVTELWSGNSWGGEFGKEEVKTSAYKKSQRS